MFICFVSEVSEEMVTCRCRYLVAERSMIGDVQISSARCGGTADALKGMFKYECSNISAPPYALLRYFCGYTATTVVAGADNIHES